MYASHVWTEAAPQPDESARRVCSCGAIARVRYVGCGYVRYVSTDDGATWQRTEYGAECPRRRR